MSLRIIHAMNPAAVGGLESAVRLLATGQRERGHDVSVVASIDGPTEPAVLGDLRAAGVAVTTIAARGRAYVREWRELEETFARLRPDIVHTHGYRADLLAGWAARHAGAPRVTTLHGFIGGDWKLRVYEMLQRRALRGFDAVVAVSAKMGAGLASRVGASHLYVVPNGYAASGDVKTRTAARAALGISTGNYRIGWIGRLSREKGADVMLRALAQPLAHHASLSFVGDGPERQNLEALARDLGVADRVTFHGLTPNASALLAAFDLFALSSRTEGTPIVLLEAMAAHTPIVTTAVGGVPDVVHAAHALLVAPDDPAALGTAIGEVHANPGAAAARADRAALRVSQEYDVATWVRRYDDVYAAALATHTARATRTTRATRDQAAA